MMWVYKPSRSKILLRSHGIKAADKWPESHWSRVLGCGVVAWIVPLGTSVTSDQGALVTWGVCLVCKGVWLDGGSQQIFALRWSMFLILTVSHKHRLFYQLLFIGFPGHPPDQPDHRTHDLWYRPRARWSGAADGFTTDVSRPWEHAGYSKCECVGYFSPFIRWAAHKMKCLIVAFQEVLWGLVSGFPSFCDWLSERVSGGIACSL